MLGVEDVYRELASGAQRSRAQVAGGAWVIIICQHGVWCCGGLGGGAALAVLQEVGTAAAGIGLGERQGRGAVAADGQAAWGGRANVCMCWVVQAQTDSMLFWALFRSMHAENQCYRKEVYLVVQVVHLVLL